ncbi:MAG: hypothetical protein CMG55_02690 [Candidatus Marinimicrobia bacterium]|nr:hypothetical protein [Candidatus Neomarinimicrobiota bacterium]
MRQLFNILIRTTFLIFLSIVFAADDKAPSNRTRDREVDIQHIKIDVTVNLETESVYGHVTHTLSPLHSKLQSFALDAEDMIIRRVRVGNEDIGFEHAGGKLFITLSKSIGWNDTVDVKVDYTASPLLGTFFFKPDDIYPDQPWQAWTQGEEEDNHHWVPLYDYPNDRSTFETILTVDQKFKAVSNGELLSIKKNKDGTHTWHWRENYPMVAYLISFVIGEYEKVEDSYNGIPVNYWVYKENRSETKRSFGLTTDMMKVFGDLTGIEYPYEKYDQIIVDDFMFGGMENITLTHNTDRTMYDKYAAPDVSSEGLVGHELAHQWYGDMLTTRNWENIWLNEGFATFLSRIYRHKKFGHDEGEYIRYGEMRSYYWSNKRWKRPTVHDKYYVPMDLFDGHVYAKGSLILTMMEDVLGEDAFWKAVKHYTRVNQYKCVETQDLKKSIEEITGQNLDWFFRQWLYEPGYPEYDVKWTYSQRNRSVQLRVKQEQSGPLFKVPIKVAIDDSVHTIWIEDKELMYEVPVVKRPELVIFNSGMIIPCKVTFHKPISEWIIQLEKATHILDRIAAINVLKTKKGRRVVERALLKAGESDDFWGVRKEAISGFSALKSKKYAEDLMELADRQDNRVRRAVWGALRNYKNNQKVSAFLQEIIDTDDKYYSVSDAFRSLVVVDTSAAKTKVDRLLNMDSHTDVIRKAAISYFGSVRNDHNYEKLKELSAYGGTTWDARPETINQLGRYTKEKPETLDMFINFLSDNTRDVRRNSVRQIGRYGNKGHLDALDELLAKDPILERDIRSATKSILNRSNKSSKNITDKKELDELNQTIENIRKLVN